MFLSLFLCPPIRRFIITSVIHHTKAARQPASTTEKKEIICTLTNAGALRPRCDCHLRRNEMSRKRCERRGGGDTETGNKKRETRISGISPGPFAARGNRQSMKKRDTKTTRVIEGEKKTRDEKKNQNKATQKRPPNAVKRGKEERKSFRLRTLPPGHWTRAREDHFDRLEVVELVLGLGLPGLAPAHEPEQPLEPERLVRAPWPW
jgi:hypothetical protein